jgi:nitroimidazol reductase NimA-like FMN-containing flavoprotein (pyridoxamine 5'-phosphate oxidase superfamily)
MRDQPDPEARWQELTRSECFDLLAGQCVGRIAVADGYGPVVFPVNYVVDRHMVVFRTGEGAKLASAGAQSRAAFEIDGTDARTRTGWSVLVRGEAVEVTDPAELARLRGLPLRPWEPGAKSHYVRLLPALVTGRRITAAAGVPSYLFG